MRAFVLGAGASLHAGYPLAAEMGTRLAAWITTLPPDHQYRMLLEQIAEAYGTLDDFETILADLMTCAPGSSAEALGAVRPFLLSGLKEAIGGHFDSIRPRPAPLYDGLSRVARCGDAIITFNYDLAVERSLQTADKWNVERGYGFPVGEDETRSPVEVLKLHGSTNWRALPFDGITGFSAGDGTSLGTRPVLLSRHDLEYLGYPDFIDPQCVGIERAASVPSMIMPALPKQFYFATSFGHEWKGFWDGLWLRAQRVIQRADELVIIGYSLPPMDERARAMLLDPANNGMRISICCGRATARIQQEFREHGLGRIQDVGLTFDDLLNSI